jgi:hypothetical protein
MDNKKNISIHITYTLLWRRDTKESKKIAWNVFLYLDQLSLVFQ